MLVFLIVAILGISMLRRAFYYPMGGWYRPWGGGWYRRPPYGGMGGPGGPGGPRGGHMGGPGHGGGMGGPGGHR